MQEKTRARLKELRILDKLAAFNLEEIREQDLWPAGFFPLPHHNQAEGGMFLPQFVINELKLQEGRDLTCHDPDFEYSAAIFPTMRPNLGDVFQRKIIPFKNNYHKVFEGILNPKQFEGLQQLRRPR